MVTFISPYISEGSGLKPSSRSARNRASVISPYISEGSGLKLSVAVKATADNYQISPYISEGSGLKRRNRHARAFIARHLPLHQ